MICARSCKSSLASKDARSCIIKLQARNGKSHEALATNDLFICKWLRMMSQMFRVLLTWASFEDRVNLDWQGPPTQMNGKSDHEG